jgi:predicted DsbA family dithiol-disulfide isomerase
MTISLTPLCYAYDPDSSFSDYLQPMAGKLLYQGLVGHQWLDQVRDSTIDAAELGIGLPHRIDRLLTEIERGNFRISVRVEDVEPLMKRLEHLVYARKCHDPRSSLHRGACHRHALLPSARIASMDRRGVLDRRCGRVHRVSENLLGLSQMRSRAVGNNEVVAYGPNELQHLDAPFTVLHWYDFICPFCYVGQQRTAILVRHGFRVVELPFQIHPEIPPGGISAGPRSGPIYAMLEREAKEAGLQLHWPPRLPDTRRALAAAEWTRRDQPNAFAQLQKALFAAHFVLGEDIEDPIVIDRHASESGINLAALHAALADGSAERAVKEALMIGRNHGVQGTPAWLVGGRLITGLRPAAEFEQLAQRAMVAAIPEEK